MTNEQIFSITYLYSNKLTLITNINENPELTHCLWMLSMIRSFVSNSDDREKTMRWLGFVQGVLYTKGIYTIDEMREHNRNNIKYKEEFNE